MSMSFTLPVQETAHIAVAVGQGIDTLARALAVNVLSFVPVTVAERIYASPVLAVVFPVEMAAILIILIIHISLIV